MFDRAGWADNGGISGFTPRWADPAPHFAPWGDGLLAPTAGQTDATASGEGAGDRAQADGWAAGYAAGHADALAHRAAEDSDRQRLCAALDRLQPMAPDAFADRLSAEIGSLLRQLVGSAAIDEALLRERCTTLSAMVIDADSAAISAHPDDIELLAPHAGQLALVADPALPRGELRLVDGGGEVALGPRTMLGQLYDPAGGAPC